MFAVLLLPDKVPYKQYFALLGVFGPICAIVYPILDPYPFPHVTLFSFFIGHFALLGNSIIYLMKNYDSLRLSYRRIVEITFGLNFLILIANIATGGDYGFLKNPPLVGDHGMLGNYLKSCPRRASLSTAWMRAMSLRVAAACLDISHHSQR